MRVIAFVGLDGSGKTTQASRFVERRLAEGADVVYEHQYRFNSRHVMQAKARLRSPLLRAQAAICEDGTVVLAPNATTAVQRSRVWLDFLFDHYFRVGQGLQRNPSAAFDEMFYLTDNSLLMIAEAVTAGVVTSGFDHYLQFGRSLGLDPLP